MKSWWHLLFWAASVGSIGGLLVAIWTDGPRRRRHGSVIGELVPLATDAIHVPVTSSTADLERERARLFMPLEAALEDEWGKGIAELRAGDPARPFVGDALVHMHDNVLGSLNYHRQIGRDDGVTHKALCDQEIDALLMRVVHTLRAVYKLRERRRERLRIEEQQAAARTLPN